MKNKAMQSSIVLTGNPMSTQHIYLQKGRMRFMRKEAKERKEQYQWETKSQFEYTKPLEGDLEIEVRLFFGDKRKRDWDNFHKLSMDSLSDIVWIDDSQVKKATVTLHYDTANPRTEIDVKVLTRE